MARPGVAPPLTVTRTLTSPYIACSVRDRVRSIWLVDLRVRVSVRLGFGVRVRGNVRDGKFPAGEFVLYTHIVTSE